jgi:hypothetical protein
VKGGRAVEVVAALVAKLFVRVMETLRRRLCRLLPNSSLGAAFVTAVPGLPVLVDELHTCLFEGASYHFKRCSTDTVSTRFEPPIARSTPLWHGEWESR